MSSHSSARVCLHPLRYQTAGCIFLFGEHNKFSCLDFLFLPPISRLPNLLQDKRLAGIKCLLPTPYPISSVLTASSGQVNKDRPPGADTHRVSRRKGATQAASDRAGREKTVCASAASTPLGPRVRLERLPGLDLSLQALALNPDGVPGPVRTSGVRSHAQASAFSRSPSSRAPRAAPAPAAWTRLRSLSSLSC